MDLTLHTQSKYQMIDHGLIVKQTSVENMDCSNPCIDSRHIRVALFISLLINNKTYYKIES